jgi:hypothetical protein
MFDEECINCLVKVFVTIQMSDENEPERRSDLGNDSDLQERNTQRFCVMLFNCLYKGCSPEICWFVDGKKLVNSHQILYLVKVKCCEFFKDGLWVTQSDLEQQNMRALTEKFENIVLGENANILNRGEAEFNETEEFCDQFLDELFVDSNNIQAKYEDFAWLMRRHDTNHAFYMRHLDKNIHGMENQFSVE